MFSIFEVIKAKIVRWCLREQAVSALELFNGSNPQEVEIDDSNGDLKFISSGITDLLVQTPTGWSSIKRTLKTVPYRVYRLGLEDGKFLECADEHLVIDENDAEIMVKNAKPGQLIKTTSGSSKVISVDISDRHENMYDLELDDENHVFYTNGILSHNTQCAAGFLLWYAMFKRDQTILIASKGQAHAIEIMDRIRFAYEECPDWLKAGCTMYNRHSIAFDNGSRIISQATTEKTGRGYSISLLYLDELAFTRPNVQQALWASIFPTLSTGGACIITSTPNGDTDLFANLWRGSVSGTNEFKPFVALWNEHPDRDESWKQMMIGSLGPLLFRQECECVTGDTLINIKGGRKRVKISELYEFGVQAKGETQLIPNSRNLLVFTPSGYKHFSGVSRVWHDKTITVRFSNGLQLTGSFKHRVQRNLYEFSMLSELKVGDSAIGVNGTALKVSHIRVNDFGEYLYDLVDVDGGHIYYTNGILSHNCEFLSSDPLLISSIKLNTLRSLSHINEDGMFKFWAEINPSMSYLVGCDVASGTGSDFSTIEVIEFPSLRQVAELRSNQISIPQLYGRLKWIVNYLAKPAQSNKAPEVYWSWENNGIGHAIGALYANDENPPLGELVSTDPKNAGVNTNGKTKILACLQLKSLVEKTRNNLQISSEMLLHELKNYVATGGSYAAKSGATDDLVSGVLVCLQILKYLANFDENAHKMVYSYDDDSAGVNLDGDGNLINPDDDEPIPFLCM
jgi:hypothetical protein